jgi:FixJ family two-component response regulator
MKSTRTIAIIDDDDGVRASLGSLVRSLGYDVRFYPSAIDYLADGTMPAPDCIITDLQMPQMSGDELQARLVAAGQSIPMIFVTAFPNEAVRNRVMAAGAIAFLEKPPAPDIIAERLARICGGD